VGQPPQKISLHIQDFWRFITLKIPSTNKQITNNFQ
jgi:hypothetical protein